MSKVLAILTQIRPEMDFGQSGDFFEEGVLDSFDLVTLVAELDRRAGARGRSAYVAATLRRALDDERRWERVASAAGSLQAAGHDWDDDPAEWVASQRRSDVRRVG